MNNYSFNEKTIIDEINDILVKLSENIEKSAYKHHWVLGYF